MSFQASALPLDQEDWLVALEPVLQTDDFQGLWRKVEGSLPRKDGLSSSPENFPGPRALSPGSG
jgi:hypothetical protein